MSAHRRLKRSVARGTTVAGVAAGIAGLTLASPFGAAAQDAAGGEPQVVNRETVKANLDSSGKLEEARVYSQLTVLGKGTVTVADPTSSKDLRDLDGFSVPMVRDGKAQYSIEVDGREDRRTVADFTGEMPVTLKAQYTLDGEPIEPEDVVGKSGKLEATYTVVNRTAEPTEITYKDYQGNDVTETVDLVTPYVGSLKILLPEEYSGIAADRADVAGDGRGANGVSWSLVLFNPLGEPAQQLTWSADVEDAVLPPATLQVVPVVPGGNSVLQNGLTTIGEGAAGATALTAGAFKIDGKVLELRDGASKILAGLTQLSDGAQALNTGLADTAAPGAQTLSDGLGSAREGGTKLSDGLGQLATGNASLAEGLRSTSGKDDLSGGADKIAAGLVSVRDGVSALVASNGLPAAQKGLQDLLFGLDHAPGTTGPTDQGGLLQGLTAIAAGVSNPNCDPSNPTAATNPCGVKEGLALVLNPDAGLPFALKEVTESKAELAAKLVEGGDLDRLVAGATAVAAGAKTLCDTLGLYAGSADPELKAAAAGLKAAACDPVSAAKPGLVLGAGGVEQGVRDVRTSSADSLAGLTDLEAGLQRAVAGLTNIKSGVDTRLAPGTAATRDAVRTSVVPGVQQLLAGVTKAVSGIGGQLAPGVDQLAAGSGTLATKLDDAADGARKLADGSATASQGSGDLAEGLGLLDDGGAKLAAGLKDAADGSGKLADGVDAVKDGVGQLESGATRLSGEGTTLLAGSANTAAKDNSKKAAMLAAMAEKGSANALPYGAPEGGAGTSVFNVVLAGANSDASENTGRGGAAVALLALGSVGGLLLRRRVIA